MSPGGFVQQCCYDKDGKLVTEGPGAGTPDRNDPDHIDSDVAPWKCAKFLDNGFGDYFNEYLRYRPPNKGNDCK
ncbi:MAG TPA: hypothetical protein PKC18_13735 [Lacipirellulaceae bacterium]|nr:hypothetical protein [Lacipirellulaceae bacterium]